jgi:phosphatidylglycerol:prolipoprotein diacylglycerol transferase
MVAIGFAAAAFLAAERADALGIDKNRIIDLVVVSVVFGIVGARLNYVLLNLDYYTARPIEILYLNKGGLVFYGGFISAFAAAFVYVKKKGLSFWKVTDLIAPYIALGHSIGRIGCFLNGCCWGMAVRPSFPLAVHFPADPAARLPTQLLSSAVLLLLFVFLRVMQDRPHFEGEIFLLYCVLYSGQRFFMEFLRDDTPDILFGLTFSQLASIILFVLFSTVLLFRWKRTRSR